MSATNNDAGETKPRFPIRIDKEGVWYYKGAEMFRKDILSLFFESLDKDADGDYFVQMSGKNHYIDVEDTAYVVKAVHKFTGETGRTDTIQILLTDGSVEELDATSLRIEHENILYAGVKGRRFKARFSRAAYYQIAEYIEYDEKAGRFTITLNDKKYPIDIIN